MDDTLQIKWKAENKAESYLQPMVRFVLASENEKECKCLLVWSLSCKINQKNPAHVELLVYELLQVLKIFQLSYSLYPSSAKGNSNPFIVQEMISAFIIHVSQFILKSIMKSSSKVQSSSCRFFIENYHGFLLQSSRKSERYDSIVSSCLLVGWQVIDSRNRRLSKKVFWMKYR